MPEVLYDGPDVEVLQRMGIRAIAERYKVTGEHLHSVCLYHGAFPVRVIFTPRAAYFSGYRFHTPPPRVTLQVICSPECGYRLAWRT